MLLRSDFSDREFARNNVFEPVFPNNDTSNVVQYSRSFLVVGYRDYDS